MDPTTPYSLNTIYIGCAHLCITPYSQDFVRRFTIAPRWCAKTVQIAIRSDVFYHPLRHRCGTAAKNAITNAYQICTNAYQIGINSYWITQNYYQIRTNAYQIGTIAYQIGTNAYQIGTNA